MIGYNYPKSIYPPQYQNGICGGCFSICRLCCFARNLFRLFRRPDLFALFPDFLPAIYINQMLWVMRMNNIRDRTTEIINNELIYG